MWALALHESLLVCGGSGYVDGAGGVAAGAAHGRRFAVEVWDVQGVQRTARKMRLASALLAEIGLLDSSTSALATRVQLEAKRAELVALRDAVQAGGKEAAVRVAVLSPHTGSDPWGVRCLATDGHAVVASGDDGFVRVWTVSDPTGTDALRSAAPDGVPDGEQGGGTDGDESEQGRRSGGDHAPVDVST